MRTTAERLESATDGMAHQGPAPAELQRMQAQLDKLGAEHARVQADLARTLADLRRIELVLAGERRANLDFRARVGELTELSQPARRALRRLRPPAWIELEIAKLLCTLGARNAGTDLWNRAKARLP